jgi:hypothetical protein
MYPPRKPFKRCIQYWIYRLRHGFFPCDCWNLDHELAVWLVPRLKLFKINNHGYPYELTGDQWDALIDEMIVGFELKTQEWERRGDQFFLTPEEEVLVQRAFTLLGEYGQNLWD